MARVLFVGILAMCLVCMLQASPVPDQAQQPSPLVHQIEELTQQGIEATKQTFGTIGESVKNFVSDPHMQKFGEDLKKVAEDVLTFTHDSLNKFVPETQ